MAKMKIYEIARSIQQQDKNIKSGDLVTLLNENGFEVKGANSNIEDEAIGSDSCSSSLLHLFLLT